MKTVLLTIAAGLLLSVLAAVAVVWSGVYDISANGQHSQALYSLLETTMRRSVKRHAAGLTPPPLDDPARISRGALCYRAQCVQCHGGPGVAQDPIGRSMQPLPGPLVDAPARWRPQELYWITRNGIKMSGMPAWQFHLDDAALWDLVAFMQHLPRLNRAEFARLAGPQAQGDCATASGIAPIPATASAAMPAADPQRGRLALTQHACSACHRIPGVTGSDVHVGPPLAGIASRQLIAGSLPNTPEQMQRWLREPHRIDAQTTMPDFQLNERDARDIAAYLATLR